MPFNVGDRVWVARCGMRDVTKPCPICFGNRQVVLILGNDDRVTLPCDYCRKGFDDPRGHVVEHAYVAEAVPYTITSVRIEQTEAGEKRTYFSSPYVLYEEDTFATEAEAVARCEAHVAKRQNEQETKVEYLKAQVKKCFAWNAGYHLRQARKDRASAERHERQAALCKARVRGGEA